MVFCVRISYKKLRQYTTQWFIRLLKHFCCFKLGSSVLGLFLQISNTLSETAATKLKQSKTSLHWYLVQIFVNLT